MSHVMCLRMVVSLTVRTCSERMSRVGAQAWD